MQLNRAAQGVIRDGAAPVTLVGGAWHLFSKDGLSDLGIVDAQNGWLIRWYAAGSQGCPPGVVPARLRRWASWNDLFAEMQNNQPRLRLLRIFLTNGSVIENGVPVDLYPYRRNAAGKLQIKEAVTSGLWNDDYFGRLLQFANAADGAGVALQLSLFNHFDFDGDDPNNPYYRAWSASVWNPANSADPTWGSTNLVQGANPAARNHNFTNTGAENLSLHVQRAFVTKVMNTLRGKGNIILELANEPRGLNPGNTAERQARWLSLVTSWIVAEFRGWRPLISVNAFPPFLGSTKLDADAWKAQGYAHYDKIDLISYHGLSAIAGNLALCNLNQLIPFHDRQGIADRVGLHRANHPEKGMIASTDGIHQGSHRFTNLDPGPPELFYAKRDGQVVTSLPDDTTLPRDDQRRQADLDNWAYWTLVHAAAAPGTVHFQNHSSFRFSFVYVRTAMQKAFSTGSGTLIRPPFTTAAWRNWQKSEGTMINFWTSVRHMPNTGETVHQFGTANPPRDLASSAATEVGFLYRYVAPATRSQSFVISYVPASVSETQSSGSDTVPKVVARLHEAAGDQPGTALAVKEVVVARGAPSGELTVTANLVAGRTYFVVMGSRIQLSYNNRVAAYGEVILRIPQIRLNP